MRKFRDRDQHNAVCHALLDYVGYGWMWSKEGATDKGQADWNNSQLTRSESSDEASMRWIAWNLPKQDEPSLLAVDREHHSAPWLSLVDGLHVAILDGYDAVDRWLEKAAEQTAKKQEQAGADCAAAKKHCQCGLAEAGERLHQERRWFDSRCWDCRRQAVRDTLHEIREAQGAQSFFFKRLSWSSEFPDDLIPQDEELQERADELEFLCECWPELVSQHASYVSVLMTKANEALKRSEDWEERISDYFGEQQKKEKERHERDRALAQARSHSSGTGSHWAGWMLGGAIGFVLAMLYMLAMAHRPF
jgi:hypothetical protein